MKFIFIIAFTLLLCEYNVEGSSFIMDSFVLLILGIVIIPNINKLKIYFSLQNGLFFYSLIIFWSLMNISYIRTNFSSPGVAYSFFKISKFIAFFSASICAFFVHDLSSKKTDYMTNNDKFFFFFMLVPMLFVLSNFILRISSIDVFGFVKAAPEVGRARTLYSLTGIEINRLPFPLSNGINNYGTFLGATLTITISLFLTTKKKEIKNMLLYLVYCVFVVFYC